MCSWADLSEYVLLQILDLLGTRDIEVAGQVCRRWLLISRDDLLWRKSCRTFCIVNRQGFLDNSFHYNIVFVKACGQLSPGTLSWRDEFYRLTHNVPKVIVQEEILHPFGINDVQFCQDGSMVATCGRDGR